MIRQPTDIEHEKMREQHAKAHASNVQRHQDEKMEIDHPMRPEKTRKITCFAETGPKEFPQDRLGSYGRKAKSETIQSSKGG